MTADHFDRDSSSVEVPSFLVTLGCVKLTDEANHTIHWQSVHVLFHIKGLWHTQSLRHVWPLARLNRLIPCISHHGLNVVEHAGERESRNRALGDSGVAPEASTTGISDGPLSMSWGMCAPKCLRPFANWSGLSFQNGARFPVQVPPMPSVLNVFQVYWMCLTKER